MLSTSEDDTKSQIQIVKVCCLMRVLCCVLLNYVNVSSSCLRARVNLNVTVIHIPLPTKDR